MTTLHFTEGGTPGKPTLIFLHGMAMGGWMWTEQMHTLTEYHLLNIELPGHGESHAVPWKSFEDTADLVAEVIANHATNGRAHIVGLSLGGVVGLYVLLRHSQRIDRAVLSGAFADAPKPLWMYTLQTRILSVLLNTPIGVQIFARMLFIPADGMQAFSEFIAKMSRDMFKTVSRQIMTFQRPPGIEHIPTPCLVVTGEKDIAFNVESTRTLAALIPNAIGVLASGVHHGWNGEAPDLFNAMVRAWINETPLPETLIPIRGGMGEPMRSPT